MAELNLRLLQFAALGFAVLTAAAAPDRVITTESPSSGVDFSKDGNSLAVFGEDAKIGVWDIASGKWVRNIELPKGETPPILLSSGRHFATVTTNGVIKFRELANGLEIAAFDDPPPSVFGQGISWVTDGVLFAASGKDPVSAIVEGCSQDHRTARNDRRNPLLTRWHHVGHGGNERTEF